MSHHPRLLELQWDSAHRQPYPSHVYYCLAPKSRLPSAVLHVNHESRQEALRFYRRVDFTTVRANQVMQPGYVSCGPICTYYNPNADIVLFAEKTYMNTIVRFLEGQRTNLAPIVRITILTSGMTLNCHGWRGNDPIECAQKLTIAGGCSPMQALHGIDPAVAQNSLVLGVRGLEDVYWVIPSELLPLRAGDIDESVGFRNVVGDGLMNGQQYFKELIATNVAFVEGGSPLPRCGSFDHWSGPNKSSFHFVSFSPHPAPGKVFDSLPILTATIPKLNFRSWERVKKIAQQTGCHIKVCVEHYIEQPRREVGFYGTPEQVTRAKEAVKTFLSVNENWIPSRQHYPETALGFRSSTHLDSLVTRDPEFATCPLAATKY